MLPDALNIGCGAHHPAGWVNVDLDPACSPHARADATALPFADGTFGRIYASHLLEHVGYHDDLPLVLAELGRVLAPGGRLAVVCPDIERAVLCGEPRQLLEQIIAWPDEFNYAKWPQRTPPIGHAWTATSQFVAAALTVAGFDTAGGDYSGRLADLRADGWPVTDIGDWQCGLVCIRSNAVRSWSQAPRA